MLLVEGADKVYTSEKNFFKLNREQGKKLFFDEADYEKYFVSSANENDKNVDTKSNENYDRLLMKIIEKCIWPTATYKGNNFTYTYTIENALEEFAKIDCVKKFIKTKEFNYNFQEDYDDAIKDFQDIFNTVSALNEKNDFNVNLKEKLFEF